MRTFPFRNHVLPLLLVLTFAHAALKPSQVSERPYIPRPKDPGVLTGPYFQGDIVASYERLLFRYGRKVAAHASARGYLRQSSGQSGGSHSRRLGISEDLSVRWDKVGSVVVVPYLLAPSAFSAGEVSVIESAMNDIVTRTDGLFSFVLRGVEVDYILFKRGISEDDCFSEIGRIGLGEQTISLTNKCLGFGFVQHEILHALGFWHEQSRSDRNAHVTVFGRSIQLGRESEFAIELSNSGPSPYDYGSVMHSSTVDFGQVQQNCVTQDFCRRRGSIRFNFDDGGGSQFFCLAPQTASAAGIRVDFFPCNTLPTGVTSTQWDVLDGVANTEGSTIRYVDGINDITDNLCLSMRDLGSGIYGGQLPLELQRCPEGLETDEQVKHMQFYFSKGLSTGRLTSTEIRPFGDPFLCLDHANSILETTVCASTANSESVFQLWDFSGDSITNCLGVQLSCDYVKSNNEFQFRTTVDAPEAIGQRTTASDVDIAQLVDFYSVEVGPFGDIQVDTEAIAIGCGVSGGIVFVVVGAYALRKVINNKENQRGPDALGPGIERGKKRGKRSGKEYVTGGSKEGPPPIPVTKPPKSTPKKKPPRRKQPQRKPVIGNQNSPRKPKPKSVVPKQGGSPKQNGRGSVPKGGKIPTTQVSNSKNTRKASARIPPRSPKTQQLQGTRYKPIHPNA